MRLFDFLKKVSNISKTEKGDITHTTTLSYCVDLFGVIGSSRTNLNEIVNLFNLAYNENPKLALKILMYTRDIKNGLGERATFRAIFRNLCVHRASVARQIIPYINMIGRYDDLFEALHTDVEKDVIKLVKKTLKDDLDNLDCNHDISLLAKWMPSINASSKETIKKAKYLAMKLGLTNEEYRKMLSKLRKGKIIENNLREKDYSFDYNKVPSRAIYKYRRAFVRNDLKRYQDFLLSVKGGVSKIHTETLHLYDILKEAYGSWGEIKKLNKNEKLAMQVKWDNFKKDYKLGNTIIVRDGSESMGCDNGLPLLIVDSLTLYFSSLLSGGFKNKFITFSNNPEIVELKSPSIYDKLLELSKYKDHTSSDITKVYDLLIEAYKNGIERKDMIKRIIIISDMEFDACLDGVSSYEHFKKQFENINMEIPEVIFWNVNARNIHFASDNKHKNIRYISGASSRVIENLITDGKLENIEFVIDTVSKYDFIEEVIIR